MITVTYTRSCDQCGEPRTDDAEILCVSCLTKRNAARETHAQAHAHATHLQWDTDAARAYARELLTACNCHDEAAAIDDPRHARLVKINAKLSKQTAELLTAATLALTHLDQCNDYNAETAQIGAQAITALREAIRHAKG